MNQPHNAFQRPLKNNYWLLKDMNSSSNFPITSCLKNQFYKYLSKTEKKLLSSLSA